MSQAKQMVYEVYHNTTSITHIHIHIPIYKIPFHFSPTQPTPNSTTMLTQEQISTALAPFYTILELPDVPLTSLSEATIRTAFKKASLLYHPDKNTAPDATAMFRKVVKAREILTSESKREQYLRDWEQTVRRERRTVTSSPTTASTAPFRTPSNPFSSRTYTYYMPRTSNPSPPRTSAFAGYPDGTTYNWGAYREEAAEREFNREARESPHYPSDFPYLPGRRSGADGPLYRTQTRTPSWVPPESYTRRRERTPLGEGLAGRGTGEDMGWSSPRYTLREVRMSIREMEMSEMERVRRLRTETGTRAGMRGSFRTETRAPRTARRESERGFRTETREPRTETREPWGEEWVFRTETREPRESDDDESVKFI
ncbi:DnaJ-domain-containing protein [Patellaria atrata CBS 101060]|uniref:DnaJ-domain-containing protein n=1 Tax=Patellaria atrata CBS 101060 TaxID=1346257 RepID=A0A9P4SGA1_9PEZI|nr:DnaJ-domain-containing protein [Patellaria atrata CBS 101060]